MKVQKWGNSLGIRIPGPFAEQLKVQILSYFCLKEKLFYDLFVKNQLSRNYSLELHLKTVMMK
jgi:hypothetical protein